MATGLTLRIAAIVTAISYVAYIIATGVYDAYMPPPKGGSMHSFDDHSSTSAHFVHAMARHMARFVHPCGSTLFDLLVGEGVYTCT